METQKGLVEIIAEKVWKFFSSVKLAVTLLIILAIVSVVGTVIQQNEPTEKYLMEYSAATVGLFETMGLFDMYHTWWYVLLLFMLTANLTVCTLDRFPRTWQIIKAPLKPIDDEALKALPFKKEAVLKMPFDKAEARAAKALADRRYKYVEMRGPGVFHLMTHKGIYSRLGVYITHISILLIFTGALIGAFFGFKGFLNLPEGEASQVVYLRNEPMWDRIMSAFGVSESRLIRGPEGRVPAMPLGYFVRCDDFEVDYYVRDNMPSGMPSEYHSTLSVFDSLGRKIFDKRIRVNDPLTYRGVTFYQSSYGTLPETNGKVVLNVRPKTETLARGESVVLDLGGEAYVSSINRTIKALSFSPYTVKNPATGQPMFLHTERDEFINPAVILEVYRGKTPAYKTLVMKTEQGEPYMPEDYAISYVDYWGARYTGLQVTKDPGVWVVYTGFILLCIGPLIAFFGSHKKLWIRIQDRKGQSAVLVAGSANKNRVGFERDFNKIVEEISK